MLTYKIIPQPGTRSYFVLVNLSDECSFSLERVYNSVTETFVGTTVNCFIETIQAVQRIKPEFFDGFDTNNPVKSLVKMGFCQISPTDLELALYLAKFKLGSTVGGPSVN